MRNIITNNQNKFNGLKYAKKKFEQHSNNNCYTFAINQNVDPYTGKPFIYYEHCQPGMLGGKNKGRDYFREPYEDYPKWFTKDLNDIGFDCVPSTYEEYVEDKGAWKIAFCWADDGDYHFYRQNKDGTWSQKMGCWEVTKRDCSDNIIYNPETCNRGRYNHFVGFFIIKPMIIN